MIVHGFSDPKHVKREKEKARALRQSHWWQQQLSSGLCHYCQKAFAREELTMDHKIPVARGGRSTRGNVVVACKQCNSQKKYYTPAELVMMGASAESQSNS